MTTLTAKTLTARDIMTAHVIMAQDDMTTGELANLLLDHEITGAPVQDDRGRLVGVVSLADVVRNGSNEESLDTDRSNPDFFVRGWEERVDPSEIRRLVSDRDRTLVRDLMTPTVYTVGEDTSVSEIADTMLSAHIHRLLVTRGDTVVGIVSTTDMLRALIETP